MGTWKWLDNLGDMGVYGVVFKVVQVHKVKLDESFEKFFIMCWRHLGVLIENNSAISNDEHGIYENLVNRLGLSVNNCEKLIKKDLRGNEVKCHTILQCSAIVNELTAVHHIETGIQDESVNGFGCLANENKRLVKKDLHENGVTQYSVTVDELPAMCIIDYKGFGCTVNQMNVHGTYMARNNFRSMNIFGCSENSAAVGHNNCIEQQQIEKELLHDRMVRRGQWFDKVESSKRAMAWHRKEIFNCWFGREIEIIL